MLDLPPDEEWCPEHDCWYRGDCPGCLADPEMWHPDDVVTLGPEDPGDFLAEPLPWPPDDDVADWERRCEDRADEERAWAGTWYDWAMSPGGN